jgi:hypothetical protein
VVSQTGRGNTVTSCRFGENDVSNRRMGEPSLSIKKAPELPHKGKSLHFQPVYEPGVTILDKTYSSAQGTGEITCRVRLLWGIGRYFRPKTGV